LYPLNFISFFADKKKIDKGNFDVGKDFHNGELILVEDIPYDEMSKEEVADGNDHINVE